MKIILKTLSVDFLAIPERILELIPPHAFRRGEGERFNGYTGLLFDPLAAVESAAHFSVTSLLHPARMARLVEFGSRSKIYPDLEEVVLKLIQATWGGPLWKDSYRRHIQDLIQHVVLDELINQAGSEENPARVRAILRDRILVLADRLEAAPLSSPHQAMAVADIRRWQNRPEGVISRSAMTSTPPGSPIGMNKGMKWQGKKAQIP